MKANPNKYLQWLLLLILTVLGIRYAIFHLNAPDMRFQSTELIQTDNSKKITINDFKGNVVIVSCFQTWCSDCAGETPVLNQLATQINSNQFKIIYISDENIGLINSFHSRFASDKIQFTKSPESLSNLGIHVFPTTYLLNKNGEVITTKLEGYNWLKEEASIRKLLTAP